MMELILAELEEEYDKAIAKIEQLEGEVLILYCRTFLRNFTCWFQWLLSVDVRGRSKV
jgi:hypothetical protein